MTVVPDFTQGIHAVTILHEDVQQNGRYPAIGVGQTIHNSIAVAGRFYLITQTTQCRFQTGADVLLVFSDKYSFVHNLPSEYVLEIQWGKLGSLCR